MSSFPSDDYLSTTPSALHNPPSHPPVPSFTFHHITSSPPLSVFFVSLCSDRLIYHGRVSKAENTLVIGGKADNTHPTVGWGV